ncbi:MAG: hypothetical protein WA006_10725 [Rhodoglobus sp.]
MHSWRDGLPAASQADIDRLLDTGLRLARQRLVDASEFEPFAILIAVDGRLLAVDLDTSELGKHPEAEAISLAARAQLRHLAPSARCTALVTNTRLSRERTDAVEVRLEHQDGVALIVLLPYKRPRFGGTTEYGEPAAYPGTREVWA